MFTYFKHFFLFVFKVLFYNRALFPIKTILKSGLTAYYKCPIMKGY